MIYNIIATAIDHLMIFKEWPLNTYIDIIFINCTIKSQNFHWWNVSNYTLQNWLVVFFTDKDTGKCKNIVLDVY